MDSLIDAAWLTRNLNDPDLRILDCSVGLGQTESGEFTFIPGRKAWSEGHIPGSAFADLLGALSETGSQIPLMRPSGEQFSRAMGALGVGPGKKVVLYDSANAMWATRVWWLLRAFGFDDAAILDGGWTAWCNAGGPVSTDQPTYPTSRFEAAPREGLFVDAPDVRDSVGDRGTILIDALSPEMFRGEEAPYARPGHIPGAINVYAMEIVDPETMRFIDEASLREKFAPALENPDRKVITYCGVGVGATSDAFNLHRLGCDNVAVYDGSLAEWSMDDSLPMVTGK